MLSGMFERFTEKAREVVVQARDAAHERGHDYCGPEHLLVGLLRVPDGIAALTLARMGITDGYASEHLSKLVPQGDCADTNLPFSRVARMILELSLREALSLGHNYIGTEHILLGLLRPAVRENKALVLIAECSPATPDQIRNEVIRLLSGSEAKARVPTTEQRLRALEVAVKELVERATPAREDGTPETPMQTADMLAAIQHPGFVRGDYYAKLLARAERAERELAEAREVQRAYATRVERERDEALRDLSVAQSHRRAASEEAEHHHAQATAARASAEKLRAYARHHDDCPRGLHAMATISFPQGIERHPCTCGLQAALDQAGAE